MLTARHSLTGCDTMSYPFKIGNIRPIIKMLAQGKANLLNSLGTHLLTVQDTEKAPLVKKIMMYVGRERTSHRPGSGRMKIKRLSRV